MVFEISQDFTHFIQKSSLSLDFELFYSVLLTLYLKIQILLDEI
jgi:hypothetical protein